ncbi:MAG: hypothetical protein HYV63_32865 [Candidatus Schekmanbacteria bacterium]|nr:hypothetical protein [Candidatus Schekmanbacteria bacterium]
MGASNGKHCSPVNGAQPQYELRAKLISSSNAQLEVWQLPSAASPHLKKAKRIAGLHGRNLALVEPRVLPRLKRADIDLGGLGPGAERCFAVNELLALQLGLMFRSLAPMRDRFNMQQVAEGIEAMEKEEAAYWLGMAMHRKYPRRVLMSLRHLLIDPKRGR